MVRSMKSGGLTSAMCLSNLLSVPTNPLNHCFSSARFIG